MPAGSVVLHVYGTRKRNAGDFVITQTILVKSSLDDD
jgi:hypothetical protein